LNTYHTVGDKHYKVVAKLGALMQEWGTLGLQTAAVELDISGQFYCGLYIDQYGIDL
jgi:hypothetical protein